jgi:hypothetical protein
MRTQDDLRAALITLERHAPEAGPVLTAVRAGRRSAAGKRGGGRRMARKRAWQLAGPLVAGAAAAAVFVAAAGSQGPAAVLGTYQWPGGTAGTPGGTAASGRQVLLTAARVVARATAPATGRYWVTPGTAGNFIPVGPADDRYTILETIGTANWAASSPHGLSPYVFQPLTVQLATGADEAAWRRAGSPTTWSADQEASVADPRGFTDGSSAAVSAAAGRPSTIFAQTGSEPFEVGNQSLSARGLLALPADPARLKALILTGWSAKAWGSAQSYLFQVTPQILTMPVTPAVRAALYQMLAGLPGVQSLGQVRDAGGQLGVAVALSGSYSYCGQVNPMPSAESARTWTFPSCVVQQRLIISPDTGLPMATELRYLKLPGGQRWPAPDGLFSYEIYGTAHWTNAGPPSS